MVSAGARGAGAGSSLGRQRGVRGGFQLMEHTARLLVFPDLGDQH